MTPSCKWPHSTKDWTVHTGKNNSWQTIPYSTSDKYTTLGVAAPKRRIAWKKIKIVLISLSQMRESLAILAPLRTQSLSTVHEHQNIYWSPWSRKCSDTNAYCKRVMKSEKGEEWVHTVHIHSMATKVTWPSYPNNDVSRLTLSDW